MPGTLSVLSVDILVQIAASAVLSPFDLARLERVSSKWRLALQWERVWHTLALRWGLVHLGQAVGEAPLSAKCGAQFCTWRELCVYHYLVAQQLGVELSTGELWAQGSPLDAHLVPLLGSRTAYGYKTKRVCRKATVVDAIVRPIKDAIKAGAPTQTSPPVPVDIKVSHCFVDNTVLSRDLSTLDGLTHQKLSDAIPHVGIREESTFTSGPYVVIISSHARDEGNVLLSSIYKAETAMSADELGYEPRRGQLQLIRTTGHMLERQLWAPPFCAHLKSAGTDDVEPVERLEVCDIDTGRKVRSVNLTRPWDNVRMSLIKGYPSAACCFDGTYAFLPAEVTTSNREETKAEMDLVGINTKTGMLVWSFLHGLLQRDGTPLGIQAPGKEVIFSSFAPSVSYDPDTAADQQTYHLPTTTCRQWTHDARVRDSNALRLAVPYLDQTTGSLMFMFGLEGLVLFKNYASFLERTPCSVGATIPFVALIRQIQTPFPELPLGASSEACATYPPFFPGGYIFYRWGTSWKGWRLTPPGEMYLVSWAYARAPEHIRCVVLGQEVKRFSGRSGGMALGITPRALDYGAGVEIAVKGRHVTAQLDWSWTHWALARMGATRAGLGGLAAGAPREVDAERGAQQGLPAPRKRLRVSGAE